MHTYEINPDTRSQELGRGHEMVVRSATRLLNSAIDALPRQGGKRRRHKTPKRRRVRKSTFRRHRKH
jgi:hypothetical protein